MADVKKEFREFYLYRLQNGKWFKREHISPWKSTDRILKHETRDVFDADRFPQPSSRDPGWPILDPVCRGGEWIKCVEEKIFHLEYNSP